MSKAGDHPNWQQWLASEGTLPGRPRAMRERRRSAVAPGVTLGGLRVDALVGQGAMGQVWAAHDGRRTVAVKVARPTSTVARDALRSEARALRAIRSPFLPRLLSDRSGDDPSYLTMEMVPGSDLQARLRKHGPLPANEVVPIIGQLCLAVRDVHRAGFIHGDVKPANMMINSGGCLTLVDLGLATGASDYRPPSNKIKGTPPFMAPEYVSAPARVSPKVDVYAIGCVAFMLLTGAPPFVGDTEAEIFAGHIYESAPSLTCGPPALAHIVARSLDKNPAQRPDIEWLCGVLAQVPDSTYGARCSVAA